MIGVFDSGVGGLTVLKYFLRDLPDYNYIYLGDNARVPYGDKSDEVIYEYTRQAIDFLFAKGCILIIIACNSASAKALRKIQLKYLGDKYPDKRVLGVVRPLAEMVAKDCPKKVGVIGTRATIESGVYKTEINNLNIDIEVKELATPLLVPLVENNKIARKETKTILEKYLKYFKDENIEALVLACTHYQFLLPLIQEIMGPDCKVYNPGQTISGSLKNYLKRHSEIEEKLLKKGERQFFTTDSVESFKNVGEKFLGKSIDDIQKTIFYIK